MASAVFFSYVFSIATLGAFIAGKASEVRGIHQSAGSRSPAG